MVKLLCVIEVERANTVEQAQAALDAFRESARPNESGLSIYRDTDTEGLVNVLTAALDDASGVVDAGEDEDYAYQRQLEAGRAWLKEWRQLQAAPRAGELTIWCEDCSSEPFEYFGPEPVVCPRCQSPNIEVE